MGVAATGLPSDRGRTGIQTAADLANLTTYLDGTLIPYVNSGLGADALLSGLPVPQYRENIQWTELTADHTAASLGLTTGILGVAAIPLFAGDVVNRVGFRVGGTAGATLTHSFGCLFSPAGVLIAQSTDRELQTVTSGVPANTTAIAALAANKTAHFLLGSQATPTPYTVPATGIYYTGICVTGSTIPTLAGRVLYDATAAGSPFQTAAASLLAVSPAGMILKPGGTAATAGQYFTDCCLYQYSTTTFTTTAPVDLANAHVGTMTAGKYIPYTCVS